MRKAKIWAVLAALLLSAAFIFAAEDALPEFVAKHRVSLYTFETGTTESWHGNGKWAKALTVVPAEKGDTAGGKYRLKADITGSNNWNQDVFVAEKPFPPAINKLVEFSFDMDIPPASAKGLEYQQVCLVMQSKSNAWYQLGNKDVMPGKSRVTFKLDPSKIKEDMWNIVIILNNSQPYKGPIYIDNIEGRIQGENGKVEGKVIDSKTKQGVADAKVVVGDKLIQTDGGGNFSTEVAEDRYKAAVVVYGYKDKFINNVDVMANQTLKLGDIEVVKMKDPINEAVNLSIDPSNVLRQIDKHNLLGQNIAPWHKPQGYRDPEAIAKLKKIGATFYRVPGGDYANLYDWNSGEKNLPEGGKDKWIPETNYRGVMVPFYLRMENEAGKGTIEFLPTINVMTPVDKSIKERIEYGIKWLENMKQMGIKFRYVEIGNEPDNKPGFYGPKKVKGKQWFETPSDKNVTKWWTNIDNVCNVYLLAYDMIKAKFPDVKIMGPVPMQPLNKQRLEGEPWKSQTDPKAPYWVERFLQRCGNKVDVLTVHEYPLWANNDARALLQRPQETWPTYMPMFREWIKKYVTSKDPNKKVEVALTEWNSGDENVMTVKMENALFCADYLGSAINQGVDLAFIWDLYTQKPGLGGGHGLMDEENDPTSKFSERPDYWVIDLYNTAFGTKLIKCESNSEKLSCYASLVDDNTIAVIAINKTGLAQCNAKFDVKGWNISDGAKVWQFSAKEYVWSSELYRPLVNAGPTVFDTNLKDKTYTFPPYSVTVIQLKK